MRFVLEHRFPLGRFHATPWRANPFDDQGEWPPSPWRLVRSVVARWHQWSRESGKADEAEFDRLLKALVTSSFSYFLPPTARPGAVLRQYQPTGFGWQPASRWKTVKGSKVLVPGMRAHGRSLVQDNCWAVPSDEPILWFIEGENWTPGLAELLDRCIERITWFGRADGFSTMRRISGPCGETPNCKLDDQATARSVPVLCPLPVAMRADLERVTDDPDVVRRSVPPGAAWRFAEVPPPAPLSARLERSGSSTYVPAVQFAINWAVAPEPRAFCRLTVGLRNRTVALLVENMEGRRLPWSRASRATRDRLALFIGKDADGNPIKGRHHARFTVWLDDGQPSRLVAWRSADPYAEDNVIGFNELEVAALLGAASKPLTWATAGSREPRWSISLIPLTHETPLPRGLEDCCAQGWRSVTPFVPSRHRLRRRTERPSEEVRRQVRRELDLRGWPTDELAVKLVGSPRWTAVHIPPADKNRRPFIGDRMGFDLVLRFGTPVRGPICIGHSSMFGLGLFAPIEGKGP
jgi:CRISPR-associated protein Csb2